MPPHQTLLALFVCLSSSLAMATTAPLESDSASTSPEALVNHDPLAKIIISDEEKHYIAEECQQFAIDDEVTSDGLTDYLNLCNHELTIAVKAALLKRKQKKARQIEAIKASRNTANRPQPM